MEFYIAQIVGLLVAGLSMIMLHFKKMQVIVAMDVLLNFLAAVQYFLLDGMSGACISMIGAANAACMLVYVKFGDPDSRRVPNILCVLFAVFHVAFGVWNLHMWYDVLPIVGALLATVAVVQSKSGNYRILRMGNGLVWIVYCVFTGAYTMIITQSLCIGSCLMAILRLDVKRKEKDTV